MKNFTAVTVATLVLGIASVGLAQQAGTDDSKPAKQAATETKTETSAPDAAAQLPDPKAAAELRAKIHRAMAALIEAEAAREPDEAKIKQLKEQLDAMRTKLQTPNPLSAKAAAELRAQMHRTLSALVKAEAAEKPDEAKIKQLNVQIDAIRAKLACPAGRDPAATCPAGGPGRGYCPVQNGSESGTNLGPGYGRGQGQGYGRGQGQGYGRGQGPGYGRGQGQGYGRGQGQGPGYGRGQGGR